MKRKNDEKNSGGPMFPRLHVNDTEKGGPRAPPRNKMALYEQLSIPSQRFNRGMLPINPNSSSGQGSNLERNMFFPHHLPSSTTTHMEEESHARQSNDSSLNTPLVQLAHGDKVGEEDDFQVPVFVQSGKGQDQRKFQEGKDSEKLTTFSSSYSVCPTKLQGTSGREAKQMSSQGQYTEQLVKSTRRKMNEQSMEANSFSAIESRDHLVANCSRLQETDASSQHERSCRPRPEDTGRGGIDEVTRYEHNEDTPRPSSNFHSGEVHCNEPEYDGEYPGDQTCGTQPTATAEKSDDVSENSMVDSISGMDISPDDVVGIIGQKRFWKARRAIVNQQRVFAVQVFELHRLIKVQKLIASSPHILQEDSAYLGKPSLKDSAVKKLADYVVTPPSFIVKRKDVSEKANNKLECSAENAVGKTSASVKNSSQPSDYSPYVGNPPMTPVSTDKMGPWCVPQAPGQQWLIPVMTPSEGLVYKPYSGFMGPGCGGCGPFAPIPFTGNFMAPGFGVSASHHHPQGMGVHPGAHPMGQGYFSPYGMPMMNTAIPGSIVEQMNQFVGPIPDSNGQLHRVSGGGSNNNLQRQSSCNLPIQKGEAIPQAIKKVHVSKDSDVQRSSASSPRERAQGIRMGQETAEGRDAPRPSPMAHAVPEVTRQANYNHEQPTRVIRVVPHNPRSATESAARIFQSIQKERKQYDSV